MDTDVGATPPSSDSRKIWVYPGLFVFIGGSLFSEFDTHPRDR